VTWEEDGAGAEVIDRAGLDALIALLRAGGYRVIGPRAVDGAIVYLELESGDALPAGWLDEQEPGRYRLVRGPDEAVFAHTVGPQGWKRFLFPPRQKLWEGRRHGAQFTIEPVEMEPVESDSAGSDATPTALLGVRACELAAIAIQDRVFLGGPYVDKGYAARRASLFIVAVNCARSTSTCFCVSMETGPKVRSGYDLALTELCEPGRHEFVVEAGSERGAALLERLERSRRGPGRRGAGRDGSGPHDAPRRRTDPQGQSGAPPLERGRAALSGLHQLHSRLSDVLLQHGRGRHRPGRRPLRPRAPLGQLLHPRVQLHSRRQHPP
jgi:hypothetical protein